MLFRKAILLIHGFAGNSFDYGELGNELQYYLDFDVYTFTLPGHNKTFISNVSCEDWINSAERMMDKLISIGYKNIYVVGHSMGGVIASYIASKYNKYVKKVVLAAPAFRYMYFKNDKIDVIKSIKKSPEIFGGLDIHLVLSRILKVPIHGTSDKIVPSESCQYVHKVVKSKVNILVNMDSVNHDCFTGKRKDEVITAVITFLRKKYIMDINKTIEM